MSAATTSIRSLHRGGRRFAFCRSGATAVEFAFVAPAFFALLYAILQTALVFFAQQVLQTATMQAGRLILTGQAQAQNMSAAQFQQAVCNAATSLFNCAGIYVNVQTFQSFSNVTMLNPIQNGKFNAGAMSYSPGASGDIEVVQVFYQWPVYTGPLGFSLSTIGNNNLLIATAAFRNEP